MRKLRRFGLWIILIGRLFILEWHFRWLVYHTNRAAKGRERHKELAERWGLDLWR